MTVGSSDPMREYRAQSRLSAHCASLAKPDLTATEHAEAVESHPFSQFVSLNQLNKEWFQLFH
eukprot:SAG31_NODE_9054_length_1342_cov_1.583266_1_plen_63_part_00